MTTFEKIYEVVRTIPCGKVMTYGQVALLAGNKRWSRVVGYALHVNPEPGVIPCHRVVTKDGRTAESFAFGGGDIQRQMLENEGVVFLPDGRVDMERCRVETI
ncbi:MAG: MGMT family protein [Acutalibacteraceae bacterium]